MVVRIQYDADLIPKVFSEIILGATTEHNHVAEGHRDPEQAEVPRAGCSRSNSISQNES